MSFHPLDQRFRQEASYSVDEDKGILSIHGLRYDPVSLLEAIGDDAYEAAFNTWKSDTWLPEKQIDVDQWLKQFHCEERFNNLCSAISQGNVLPFIGSGMSAPSGFLTWSKVLAELRKRSAVTEARFNELMAAYQYEQAAQEVYQGMPAALFEECFGNLFPDHRQAPIEGAVIYMPLLFPASHVVTTNYDRVLEKIYRTDARDSGFQECLYGQHLQDFQRHDAQGRQCLVKIHGDRSWQDFRALTVEEYNGLYAVDGACRLILNRLFGRALLFMGCSLVNDRTLEIFRELTAQNNGNHVHYALLQAPADEEKRISREYWLAERSIYPIWYDGDHDSSLEAIFTVILDRLGRL